MSSHIIETERHGLWISVALVVALLGVLLGLAGVVRVYQLSVTSQLEVFTLNKRIADLEKASVAKAHVAAPAATPAPAAAPADMAPAASAPAK